jgi:hypothetical protein
MALSWRKESPNVRIACSQQMTHALQRENRPEGKLKVYVAGRDGIHSLDDNSI